MAATSGSSRGSRTGDDMSVVTWYVLFVGRAVMMDARRLICDAKISTTIRIFRTREEEEQGAMTVLVSRRVDGFRGLGGGGQ